jgi:hypothetical protein
LLLILIPWSAFWERNYFAGLVPGLETLLGNAFVRGAVSGLGLVNVLAAIAELVDLFVGRGGEGSSLPEDSSRLSDRHVP